MSPVRQARAGEPVQLGRHRRPPRPCPCCGHPGGLCDTHRARLAPLKAILNPGKDWNKTALPRAAKKAGRKTGLPTCTNLACGEPRVPPAAFCFECQHAGFVEEDDR